MDRITPEGIALGALAVLAIEFLFVCVRDFAQKYIGHSGPTPKAGG